MFERIKEIQQEWFADWFSRNSEVYEKGLHQEKLILFQKLKEQESKIPDLLAKGSIRIVELGAGSGSNLKYYPDMCNLTVVDPNKFFEPYFQKTLEGNPGITLEGYITAYGEDMRAFIEDASVDAVVVTAVGCSVNDIQKVYKEIQRILVPGGKFYYLEHIHAPRGSSTYYKQMAARHLWKFFLGGCHIDRDLDKEITKADFAEVDQRLFQFDTSLFWKSHFIAPHVTGVATNK